MECLRLWDVSICISPCPAVRESYTGVCLMYSMIDCVTNMGTPVALIDCRLLRP